METRARYALIGFFTLAVIVAGLCLRLLAEAARRDRHPLDRLFRVQRHGRRPRAGRRGLFRRHQGRQRHRSRVRPRRSQQGAGHGGGSRRRPGQDRHQGGSRLQFPHRRRLYRDDRGHRRCAEHLHPDAAQDRRHPVGFQRRACRRRLGGQQAVIDRRASRHLPRREPGVRSPTPPRTSRPSPARSRRTRRASRISSQASPNCPTPRAACPRASTASSPMSTRSSRQSIRRRWTASSPRPTTS